MPDCCRGVKKCAIRPSPSATRPFSPECPNHFGLFDDDRRNHRHHIRPGELFGSAFGLVDRRAVAPEPRAPGDQYIPSGQGIIFMVSLGGTIVSPILSLFIADLNGPENAATAAGMIMAGTASFSAISAVVIGRFSDRIGRTRVLLACLLGACLAYLPQAFVQDVWQLLFLRVLLGVFLGGLMPAANALVAELVPAERRGVAFGLTVSAQSMANAVGPLIAAGIAANFGMHPIFLVTAAFFALNFFSGSLSFRRAHKTSTKPAQAPSGPEGCGCIQLLIRVGAIDTVLCLSEVHKQATD